MKYFFLLSVLVSILCSCRKVGPGNSGSSPTQRLPYTPVPTDENTETDIVVLSLDNYMPLGNMQVTDYTPPYSELYYTYNTFYHSFSSGQISSSIYKSHIFSYPTTNVGFNRLIGFKAFPLTKGAKNYVDIKSVDAYVIGTTNGYDSSAFNLPTKGKILFPPRSFKNGVIVYGNYTSPAVADYAVTLPCYPMGDDNGRRYYLNSYGVYNIFTGAGFIDSSNVKIQIPVPDSLAATAPDSLSMWSMFDPQHPFWQKQGYAHKIGNYYEAIIHHFGFWNFAQELDGVYVTLHLRSNANLPLPGIRLILSNGGNQIAEGWTDGQGDAFMFVPVNKNINVTCGLVDNQTLGDTLSLGSFNYAADKTITLPAQKEIVNFKGNVFNCDGRLFGNGSAVLRIPNTADDFTVPIVNGTFKAATPAILIGGQTKVTFFDNSGTKISDGTTLLGAIYKYSPDNSVVNHNINFYTCPNADQAYLNYAIDGVDKSISAPASSGDFTGDSSADYSITTIKINHNGQGVIFSGDFLGASHYWWFKDISVNNQTCTFDRRPGSGECLFTRIDAGIGGFMEGCFSIPYLDAQGTSHIVSGNFRVKRTH